MTEMTLTVASWADREDLVVEIEAGGEDFGLVTHDMSSGKPVIEIYPRMSGQDWRLDLDDVREILDKACGRIRQVAGPVETE